MAPFDSNPQNEKSVWSAHHLPSPKANRMLSFSILAVVAALVVIVLASAVKDPIMTAGSQMEPTRFKATAHQAGVAGKTGIVVASGTN